MPQTNLHFILPVLIIAAGILAVLIIGLKKNSGKYQVILLTGFITLLLTAISTLGLTGFAHISNILVYDAFSKFFLLFAVFVSAVTLILASQSKEVSKKRFAEFTALLLTISAGLFLMAAANELLMMYLAIETVSLSSYVLTGFRKNNPASHEAALKYVIFGGVASGVMLFGMSMLYGIAGTTSFSGIARIFTTHGAILSAGRIGMFTAIVATIFVFAGLLFKIAAVPFHAWCPDVYQGAPTPFTGFLSVAPKAAGFALLLRFLSQMMNVGAESIRLPTLAIIGIVAAITMTLGNLTAIHQMNVKRLLAFSSVAHAGYMLMGVVAFSIAGSTAILLYLVFYLFMNIGAFAVVQIVADSLGSEDIRAYRGLGFRAAPVALAMGVFLFSLAGVPPLAGFIGKFYLFSAILKNGGFWLDVLAVIGIVNSAIALFYYARILREMFLTPAEDKTPVVVAPLYMAILVIMVIPTILFGVYWEPLQHVVRSAVSFLVY